MSNGNNKLLTHVAGTFVIQADGAFLNGAGIDSRREDKNTTIPKSYRDGVGNRVPYVSAQAWRRWLRNTLIEETGWPVSELRAIDLSEKGTTNKIAGELNPVDFAEDDLFGYMRAAKGQGREAAAESDDDEKSETELQRVEEARFFARISSDMKSVLSGKQGRGKKTKNLTEADRLELAKNIVKSLQGETDRRLALDEESLDEQIRKRLDSVAQHLRDATSIESLLPQFRAEFSQIEKAFNPGRLKALMRASPFASSLLISIRRKGWEGLDKGFVHLKEGTPLPYNTEFYNTHLQGVFCLAYRRLGVFWNLGDRIELDEEEAERLLAKKKIRVAEDRGKLGKIYEMTNAETERKSRATELLAALAHLRGGAKQAQFGTDVSPKALVLVGLSCGNPVFNHLFMDGDGQPTFNIAAFKEIVRDYANRIATPVLIGLRAGYLRNEADVRALGTETLGGIEVRLMTPIEAARDMGELLP